MGAESFLDAECELWVDREEESESRGESRVGAPGETWRDWMIDFLATAHLEGEGFDGKRPNCGAGWQGGLEDALRQHSTSFKEVLIAAFGMDRDRRPRSILRPDSDHCRGLAQLRSVLSDDETSRGLWGVDDRAKKLELADEEKTAALRIAGQALGIAKTPKRSTPLAREVVDMDTIAAARLCVARCMEANGGERTLAGAEWAKCRDYLDMLVLRRAPSERFFGMALFG